MIYDNILQVVGSTPVVKLQRIGADLDVEFYGKCDFLNPGGSLKDRVAVRMIEQMEKDGRLQPGATIIEPTSGNTGIGMAMASAVKGYKMVVTMCDKISMEKEWIIRALGGDVHRTPTDAPHTSPESQLGKAQALTAEIDGAVMPDQYSNPDNPDAHYHGTGAEIWDDFGEDLDAVVIGVGTGGTIMGISNYLKERNPDIQVIGVEPHGSLLGQICEPHPYTVEGIGYDWIPDIFKSEAVDRFLAVHDQATYDMARRLIREEGLLVGGSSGAIVVGMLEVAKDLKPGAKVCGILADGIRNYLGKFVSDDWMLENGFEV
ncbi:MAG: cysteine synthase family protein [bacterium]|nr:cysteine synthase family protein [bacterium]